MDKMPAAQLLLRIRVIQFWELQDRISALWMLLVLSSAVIYVYIFSSADHSSPSSSAEVKNCGTIPPLPHTSPWRGD
jgi:hypothetical protein